jgi:imidazolonepropionase-like amidohydrolase
MRANVRQILRYGADFIKVIATGAVLTSGTTPGAPEFTEDELKAAVETAGLAGAFVAAHAHGTEGIKRAVRAGVRSIEHGSVLDDEAIELMVDHGTYLVADMYDGDWIGEQGPAMGYSQEALDKNDALNDTQRAGFRKAVAAGVNIAFGTDSGVIPHGTNARQFALYVKFGLTPAQALQSATHWGAEMMGRQDRVGSLTPGAYADLVVIPGDPLEDITALERPARVMKGGNWV